MASNRQIAANRANAAKSTGPKTSQGKAASSRNNLRHGLFASSVVLDAEVLAQFDLLRANLQTDFPPESVIEAALLETLAVTRWRQLRLWAAEKATLTNEMHRQKPNTSESADTRLARAFRTLCDESCALTIIGRLENRFERQFNTAVDRLLRIREEKAAFSLIQSQSQRAQPPPAAREESDSPVLSAILPDKEDTFSEYEANFEPAIPRSMSPRSQPPNPGRETTVCLIRSQSPPVSKEAQRPQPPPAAREERNTPALSAGRWTPRPPCASSLKKIFQQRKNRGCTTATKKRTRQPLRPASRINRIKRIPFPNTKPISTPPGVQPALQQRGHHRYLRKRTQEANKTPHKSRNRRGPHHPPHPRAHYSEPAAKSVRPRPPLLPPRLQSQMQVF